MKKWIPWILVVVCAAWVLSTLRTKPETGFKSRSFGRLPVLVHGRIQPMDSVARDSLRQLRTKQTVPLGQGKKLTATQWLMEVLMKPEVSDTRKVFRINNLELLGMLNLSEKKEYFSYNQIQPNLAAINKEAQRASKIDSSKRSAFEQQLLNLYNGLMLYQRLQVSLRPSGSDDFAAELKDYQSAIGPGVAAVQASQSGKSYDKAAYNRILQYLAAYQDQARYAYMLVVPPNYAKNAHGSWKNMGASLMASARTDKINPAVQYYATLISDYRQGNITGFNHTVQDFHQWLSGRLAPKLKKTNLEFTFNAFQPFYKATIFYVLAFVLAFIFWFSGVEWLRRSALYVMILAWIIHTVGMSIRMYIEGRPPVTNLYSSAIFIGWGAVILGMVLERIYRDGIGIVAGSLVGFATQVIAHNLSMSGDTMEMMRAVLNNNFWLATHVVVITLGYASTFLAGLLGIIYIARGVFTKSLTSETSKSLSRMVFGIICFATLFSFAGTVLGGIWADQSWGRFWGWDPKENGALLIVLWNAIILHARWGGMIRERGIMNMAIFGNVVTSYSWFGVNMLGVGLHSYGFMQAAFNWLIIFVASQLAIILVGCLPLRFWKSFQNRIAVPTKPKQSGAGGSGGGTPAPATT